MRFSVLSRIQVIGDDGAVIPIPQPKQRALLAVLLLQANQELSVARLTESLWEQDTPTVSLGALRTQIWALRKLLGPADRLHTGEHRGYQLEVHSGELDFERFRELAMHARRAHESGDLAGAVRQVSEALALWADPPLADVPATLAMGPLVQRLLDERAAAQELLTDARLGLGQFASLIPELRESTAADPANERLWEQLMLALAGAGRTADALGAYQQARSAMQAELGLEPGLRLRQLHQQVLDGEPSGRQAAAPAVAVAGHVVPRQLPAPVRPFVGRDAELAELDHLLNTGDGPGAMVIDGTAGVGKTALAVHWAHRVAGQFPDGQLYANLRGFGPTGSPMTAAVGIRAMLDALEVPPDRIPASLDAQTGLYRSLMAGRRMLLLLDNARNAEQVRPLLPGSPGCLVIVTSRRQLAGLAAVDGARSVTLDLLTDADARALLEARLGPARIARERDQADELVRLCARLPLALVIAAARIAARPQLRLAAFTSELADAQGRLDALETGDALASARAVFSWSVRALSLAAARMFALLGLHPGPSLSVPAAASLAGVAIAQARIALAELASASLTAESAPGRFSLHDLLRAYAAEQACLPGDKEASLAAVGRVLDHYLHTAHAAAGLLNPQREAIALPRRRSGVAPERLADRQQAQSWLEAEREVLVAAAGLAAGSGFDAHAWQLPWAMANFLDWHGYWDEWAATQRAAVAAATRLSDTVAQASTRRLLGQASARLGDYEQARAHLAECAELYRRLGDKDGEARVHQTLSWLIGQLQGDYRIALGHCEQALALYRHSGNQAGLASALSNAGMAYINLGYPRQGRAYCEQSLALHSERGSLNGQANAWHGVGAADFQLGDAMRAVECYRRALPIFRELGHRQSEAGTLADIGDAHEANGDLEAARQAWHQALDILDELQHSDAARIRAKLRHPGTAVGSGGSSPRASTTGGSGDSSPRAGTTEGSGGSSPRASTAGGSGGSSPRASTVAASRH